eukprot:XP_011417905.1 PREDICTED: uncharacterized protein LOC105321336 [Crassostrea gigas]
MDPASTTYRVHQCSKCPRDTEYYCEPCSCDLCQKCKENHVKNLKTIDHNVVSHHEKFNNIPTQEICVRHPRKVYINYCEPCQIPVCDSCFGHKSHRFPITLFRKERHNFESIQLAYKTKLHQHRGTIHTIRSEALFYRPVLLPGITDDIKTCRTEFSLYQSEILKKAQKLKDLIDCVLYDLLNNVFCDSDFKHRCLNQKIEIIRHIASLQIYVYRYEQSTLSPYKFLSSIKTVISQIHLQLHTSQLSMTESLNKEDVMESLSAIQITERGNRRVGNQCLLKLMSAPVFQQSLTLRGVDRCYHISCVSSDRAWVSDKENNLILISTKDDILHHQIKSLEYGLHTVNSKMELIYVDSNHDIKIISSNLKESKVFIERTNYAWRPHCVYWSSSFQELLVGMQKMYVVTSNKAGYCYKSGKVNRYDRTGHLTQTIGQGLYRVTNYITENNNGDVVVSAFDKVVVTERGGRHRFSYTGPPSGSRLLPRGICTDALSHILVCDGTTKTVQMLDKDGQFLSHLLIRPSGIFSPRSLSYDVNTHRLWVGSQDNNTVVLYRFIDRQGTLRDQSPNVMESLVKKKKQPHQENECQLIYTPKLDQTIIITGIYGCNHMSCVTSDRVWVSDREKNLMLTNTRGDILHHLNNLCRYFIHGSHTVTSKSELIYIDDNHNIIKLMNDLKHTTTFVETSDSTWKPRCVHWSSSTEDLLVGSYRNKVDHKGKGKINRYYQTGKVTRYNKNGQLTNIIQQGNTGLELYNRPDYITENNNGDVVVSDTLSAVVVTEREGIYRFTYTGHPSGSRLEPHGVCADEMSHILVCDGKTHSVHIIDQHGQFLSQLFTSSEILDKPYSLSYNSTTQHLWVGSLSNKVFIYKYETGKDTQTDQQIHTPDGDALSSSTSAVEWR